MGRAKTAPGPPRYPPLSPLRARGLLRGSSPTRWVAPKQHRGLRRAFSPAFRAGGIPLSLGAWVPKNLARRSFGLLVSPARCCSTGSGRLLRGPRVNLLCHPYAREGQAVVCPLLRGRSPTRWVAPKQHRGLPALTSFVTLTRARARQ